MLAEAEAVRLASFRDAIRSEQRQQLAQGLATITSSQGQHVESAVATRTSPIQARLDALDVLVRGLHSRGVAVWSRLDTIEERYGDMEEALVEETGALLTSQEDAVQTQEEMSGRLMQRCAALEDELQRLARQVSALTQETGTCRSDWRKDKEVALLQADLEAMLETTSERLAANLARCARNQCPSGLFVLTQHHLYTYA
jgi:predicted RNase H-like nuclease (RuvC/YqgF family)